MTGRDLIEQDVEDVTGKLETGEGLAVDDIKFILRHAPSIMYYPAMSDYGELEPYRDDIEEAFTPELGHVVYASILEQFESAGVIDELRPDLLDPSLDPHRFERAQSGFGDRIYHYPSIEREEDVAESVGRLHAPVKQPTSLLDLRISILDYLFCTGRGFHFDAEMIHHYEADYWAFLRSVIDCSAALTADDLTVEADDRGRDTIVHVSVTRDGRTYQQDFEAGSDRLRFQALDPLRRVLEEEASATVYYTGGNNGWILIVKNEHEELVMGYI